MGMVYESNRNAGSFENYSATHYGALYLVKFIGTKNNDSTYNWTLENPSVTLHDGVNYIDFQLIKTTEDSGHNYICLNDSYPKIITKNSSGTLTHNGSAILTIYNADTIIYKYNSKLVTSYNTSSSTEEQVHACGYTVNYVFGSSSITFSNISCNYAGSKDSIFGYIMFFAY